MIIKMWIDQTAAIRAGKTKFGIIALSLNDDDLAQLNDFQLDRLAIMVRTGQGPSGPGIKSEFYSPTEATLPELKALLDAIERHHEEQCQAASQAAQEALRVWHDSEKLTHSSHAYDDSDFKPVKMVELTAAQIAALSVGERQDYFACAGELCAQAAAENAIEAQRCVDAFKGDYLSLDGRDRWQVPSFEECIQYLPKDEAVKVTTALNAAWKTAQERNAKLDQQAADEKRAKKLIYDQDRAQWITAHGSDYLQRLAAEGIGHDRTYRHERLSIDRPGWEFYYEICGTGIDILNAAPLVLAELDAMRATGVECSAQWLKIGNEQGCHLDTCLRLDPLDCGPSGPILVSEFLGKTVVKRIKEEN